MGTLLFNVFVSDLLLSSFTKVGKFGRSFFIYFKGYFSYLLSWPSLFSFFIGASSIFFSYFASSLIKSSTSVLLSVSMGLMVLSYTLMAESVVLYLSEKSSSPSPS